MAGPVLIRETKGKGVGGGGGGAGGGEGGEGVGVGGACAVCGNWKARISGR